jgi:hypothetical protein
MQCCALKQPTVTDDDHVAAVTDDDHAAAVTAVSSGSRLAGVGLCLQLAQTGGMCIHFNAGHAVTSFDI